MTESKSLANRSLNAAFWNMVVQFGNQGVSFVLSIFLARILTAADYGLVGMLVVFWVLSGIFSDSGFAVALIRSSEVSSVQYNTVFCYNLVLGCCCCGLLIAGAPLVADFYRQPELTNIVRVAAWSVPLTALGIVPNVRLIRELNQRYVALATMISAIISGSLAVYWAYIGYGVWALVWQQVLGIFLKTILLWFFARWRPCFQFSFAVLKQFFGFGSKMFLSAMLNSFFESIYNILIGRMFPPAILGYYSKANRYTAVVPQSIVGTINSISLPLLAKFQDNDEKMQHIFRKILVVLTVFIAPGMVMIFVLAKSFVLAFLTEKWIQLVPYIWCFAGLYFLLPIQALNVQTIIAKGHSHWYLRLELIKKGLIILSILLTMWYGVIAMILGQVVVAGIAFFINGHYTSRSINYSITRQLRDIAPPVIFAIITGGAIWSLNVWLLTWSAWGALGISFSVGAIFYLLLLHLFCIDYVNETWELLEKNKAGEFMSRFLRIKFAAKINYAEGEN